MRVCLVYDCLFPWTIGGAERWYRELAVELAARGHDVTYLTRRQWEADACPEIAGVRVVAVAPMEPLYGPDGRRRIGQAVRFGKGVYGHLVRNRSSYDIVHTCSFPYFSLLGARAATVGSPTTMLVDWFEVWSADYWREYLGGAQGAVGSAVQRLCAVVSPTSFVFSDLHARRLADIGARSAAVRLSGLYRGERDGEARRATGRELLVVYAGRHIAEKRVDLLPAAIAEARRTVPALRGLILGDGPERGRVQAEIERCGASSFIDAPGFVAGEDLDRAFARAACMALPSAREGYGLVVIEAAAAGTPSVVIDGPDNAAAELVVEGVNGTRASSPSELGRAIARAVLGGDELRRRTAAWFDANVERLSMARSVEQIVHEYERAYGR